MNMLIDTCVLPRSRLETAKIYRERFGPSLGFELLMMSQYYPLFSAYL